MPEGERAVLAEGLTRRFGRFLAVDHVDLHVPRGRIFGFVGPSGCGKSTTIRMLCGLLKPTSGRALVNGYDIEREPETLRQNIGYMAQKFSLYPDLTVRENLEFYGSVYGLARRPLAARIEQVFEQLDLRRRADSLTADLPLGWKQRVALGAAILHLPPILFLDEPTSGVDPASRRMFWQILDVLAEREVTIFVTTHTMEEADRCERVAIMYGGRIIADDSPTALKEAFGGTLYQFDVDPLLAALEAARRFPSVLDAVMFGTALHLTLAVDDPEAARGLFAAEGVSVHYVRRIAPTLEDVFVQRIAQSRREERPPPNEERRTHAGQRGTPQDPGDGAASREDGGRGG
jgi:ABC-2 type transport system ATP-binding protein